MVEAKKHILTSQGMQALEDELQDLKVVKRKEIAQKIKEAREQGDLVEAKSRSPEKYPSSISAMR